MKQPFNFNIHYSRILLSFFVTTFFCSPTKNITEHSHSSGIILEINENKGLIIQCYNNTQLRINTVYTDEGFMNGYKLLAFGIKNGEQFASL